TPFEVPNQKYLLEKRDQHGHYLKVETYDKPVTPEYVLKRHGPGEYFLKPCKPTFWDSLWHEKIRHRTKCGSERTRSGYDKYSEGGPENKTSRVCSHRVVRNASPGI